MEKKRRKIGREGGNCCKLEGRDTKWAKVRKSKWAEEFVLFCFVLFGFVFVCFVLVWFCFCLFLFFCFVLFFGDWFCFFVLFCFGLSLFETTEICLGSTKMEISTEKKTHTHFAPGKMVKSDFAPPVKYSSYASECRHAWDKHIKWFNIAFCKVVRSERSVFGSKRSTFWGSCKPANYSISKIIYRHVNVTRSYLAIGQNWVSCWFTCKKHTIKNLAQVWSQSNFKFMTEMRRLNPWTNKRNLNTKRHFWKTTKNNAYTTLLHLHDDTPYLTKLIL